MNMVQMETVTITAVVLDGSSTKTEHLLLQEPHEVTFFSSSTEVAHQNESLSVVVQAL